MPGASEAAGAPRPCGVCGRQYKRSSHLRRHEATHTLSEQHKCPFCDKAFARRDVCRKHLTNCPQRTSLDDPPPACRGQRPRACDNCFKSKVLCGNTTPCSRCTARDIACTHSRALEKPGAASTSPGAAGGTSTTPAKFLLGLTDPKADSMIEIIANRYNGVDEEAGSSEQSHPTGFSPPPGGFPIDYGFFHWGFHQYQPGEFSETLADAFMDYGIQFDPSCSGSSSTSTDEGLAAPISAILEELGSLYSFLEANNQLPGGDYYFDVATAREILTPVNIRTHIGAYFRYTNFYCPIIHRPTYDIEDASPVLLLSMFLCGSLYSGDKGRNYRGLYNIAEEYAFKSLGIAMERHTAGGVTGTNDIVEVLQAATLIHNLHWIISCASSRRRNRYQRLPTLVSAVRTLGYTRLRHATHNPVGELDWGRFIELEACIRIGTLVVESDWNQGGMYHSPFLTAIYELTGDMPCHRPLWEAKDEVEFQSIIHSRGVKILHRPYSVRSCVEDLMRNELSTSRLASLSQLTITDLGLILVAMLVQIASARFSCTLPALAPKALRATHRWQDLWKAVVVRIDKEELKTSGLVQHSTEMCWLAKRLIEVSAAGKEDAPYFEGVAHESLEELHALVRELQNK